MSLTWPGSIPSHDHDRCAHRVLSPTRTTARLPRHCSTHCARRPVTASALRARATAKANPTRSISSKPKRARLGLSVRTRQRRQSRGDARRQRAGFAVSCLRLASRFRSARRQFRWWRRCGRRPHGSREPEERRLQAEADAEALCAAQRGKRALRQGLCRLERADG